MDRQLLSEIMKRMKSFLKDGYPIGDLKVASLLAWKSFL